VWWGIPVQPLDQYKRMNAHLNKLAEMRNEIKQLRQEIDQLKSKN
jgi:UDP-3-O-[3-hydroxymyristoyl] glucosamine N-acyltransferase